MGKRSPFFWVVSGCLLLLLTGCESLLPASQQEMRDAVEASERAARSEEKAWALVLRMEEMAQRMEEATLRAEAAANKAEAAARSVEVKGATATKAAAKSAAKARQEAENAALEVKRIEEQEGRSLQQVLEFLREMGYKP